MLTLVGVANFLLGTLLILYTLGALLYVLPERVSRAGKIFTGVAGFGMGVSFLFSGINAVSGAISTVEVTGFSTFLAIAVGIKIIPIVALIGLLYLIISRKYHTREGR